MSQRDIDTCLKIHGYEPLYIEIDEESFHQPKRDQFKEYMLKILDSNLKLVRIEIQEWIDHKRSPDWVNDKILSALKQKTQAQSATPTRSQEISQKTSYARMCAILGDQDSSPDMTSYESQATIKVTKGVTDLQEDPEKKPKPKEKKKRKQGQVPIVEKTQTEKQEETCKDEKEQPLEKQEEPSENEEKQPSPSINCQFL